MNRQRKVVITITYNEMGIIIDTKAEEVAQPEYEELTPEEAASEIASGSIMSASYWFDLMIRLKQMGYAICRKVSEQHEST